MSDEELAGRFIKERDSGDTLRERIDEYTKNKIALMIDMIKRAIRKGVSFGYVLADSWFACKDVIRFVRFRRIKCDYLGMIKVGENDKTRYLFRGNPYTAPALIKLLDRQGSGGIAGNYVAITSRLTCSLRTSMCACFLSEVARGAHGTD